MRSGLAIAALAVVYVVLARIGLGVDALSGLATTVWPPTGVSLAALVLGGPRLWPGVAVGALVANLSAHATVESAFVIAAGNTLEAVIGARLLRAARFSPALDRLRDVLALLGVALLSTAVSASFGLGALRLGGSTDPAARLWMVWWVGDALGDLLVAPVLFAWSAARPRARRLELAVVLLVALAASWALFFRGGAASSTGWLRHTYLVFPILLWAALRFGTLGAATGSLLVAAVAVGATATGHGPFVQATRTESLLYLQIFQAVMALTTLLVGAATAERDRAVLVREEFLAIASHELRTPLSPLRLRVDSFLRRLRDEQRELPPRATLLRDFDALGRQVDRFARLVDDLLDVSRIRSGHMELNRESVDLAEVVHDSCARLKSDLDAAGCALAIETAPVRGNWDRSRLDQVVANLLSNAAKYGGGRPVRVEVSREGESARLAVKDSGPGIAPDERERIFDPFERGGAAEGRAGLGLGLYIARRIVEAHGGTVRVESAPGAGSAFVVMLPAR